MFVALLMIAMVAFLMATAWAAVKDDMADDEADPAKDFRQNDDAVKPETLEGVLVKQLLDDEINRLQYRRAMQRLAERDADRHPLAVPGDS